MNLLLRVDLIDGLLVLKLDVWVVRRQVTELTEISEALLSLADANEVSGCLEEERNHDAHAAGWNELDRHGGLPL